MLVFSGWLFRVIVSSFSFLLLSCNGVLVLLCRCSWVVILVLLMLSLKLSLIDFMC